MERYCQKRQKEVPILQKKGADIIVVLAHSGIGEQKPAELDAIPDLTRRRSVG